MKMFLSIISVFSISLSAQALTLAEKKQIAKWKEDIGSSTEYSSEQFKKKCGYDMPVSLDEKMVTPFMADNSSLPAFCDSPRSVMASMCDDAISKTEITKKVKKVTCLLGKKGEISYKLNGTELVYTVGLGASNLDEAAKKFLENNL